MEAQVQVLVDRSKDNYSNILFLLTFISLAEMVRGSNIMKHPSTFEKK